MSSMSAYFATVFRLTWSIRAISDLERPAASIDRISFTVSRGTVISPSFPGGLAKVSARGNRMARAALSVPGVRPFCSNCSVSVLTVLDCRRSRGPLFSDH